jgi:hypothetical protein
MAKPTLQEIILGGFAYFVESGLTVDAQTISATVKPDTDPTTNWTNATLGNVLNFKFGNESIDSPFMQALPSGGHQKINRSYVVQDFLTLQTREMNELIWRLQAGLTVVIAEGTAQTPGLSKDRKIEGWLRLQGRNINGFDRFIQDWWCEVRLEGENVFDEKVVTPSLRFTLIKAVAGVAVAGNSTNFPAQA